MAIDTVVEEVADNLEEIADATRKINTMGVGFFLGGMVVGTAFGFYWGWKYKKESVRAEAFKESAKEVAAIREDYHRRLHAIQKEPLETIIKERGYRTEEVSETPERPLPAPVPGLVDPRPEIRLPIEVESEWDQEQELAGRLDGAPYIIHQNEFNEPIPPYSKMSYTYYAEDDVLVDENDKPVAHGDILVGQGNLRFGHGSDDEDVVFVRNDRLNMDMEISRVYKSYEQEFLGIMTDSPEVVDDDSDPD